MIEVNSTELSLETILKPDSKYQYLNRGALVENGMGTAK
jgi:hypothetical protein